MTKAKEEASIAFQRILPRSPTLIDTASPAGAANIKEEEDGSRRAEWKEWEKRNWVSPMQRSTDKGGAMHEERAVLAF